MKVGVVMRTLAQKNITVGVVGQTVKAIHVNLLTINFLSIVVMFTIITVYFYRSTCFPELNCYHGLDLPQRRKYYYL